MSTDLHAGDEGQPAEPTTLTPEQAERARVERTGDWPDPAWGPFHRHFANGAIHRDGGPECDQPGTPRRVYVFDSEHLDEHERQITERVRREAAADAERWRSIADQLAEAIRLTREYVGEHWLPARPGWSWFDATEAYRTAAAEPPSR